MLFLVNTFICCDNPLSQGAAKVDIFFLSDNSFITFFIKLTSSGNIGFQLIMQYAPILDVKKESSAARYMRTLFRSTTAKIVDFLVITC